MCDVGCLPIELLARIHPPDLPILVAVAREGRTKPELRQLGYGSTGNIQKIVDRLKQVGAIEEGHCRAGARVLFLAGSRPDREVAPTARSLFDDGSRSDRDVAPGARSGSRPGREIAPGARSGAPHGGDDVDDDDDHGGSSIVELLEAEGLDHWGARVLARDYPESEIRYTLEHVWPILKPTAMNAAGRLTVAVRNRTTPAAARGQVAASTVKAGDVARATVPAGESKVARAVEQTGPLAVTCPGCHTEADQTGRRVDCRTCGTLWLSRTDDGRWVFRSADLDEHGYPLEVAVTPWLEAVPS